MAKQLDFLTSKLGYMGTKPIGLENQPGVEDGNNRNFNNYRPNQGGGNYNNYGNKVHPNLSYGNPNNALQPPPEFQVSNGQVKEPKKEELGDVLMAFMKQTSECMISQISQAVGVQHQPGQFPSHTIVNPKDCKAFNLRNGKSYEGPTMPEEKEKISQEEVVVEEVVEEEEPVEEKKKLDDQFSRFLDIFRKVHINISLVEALQQMPSYAKFLKDVISKKRRWVEHETVNLTESCSAIIQKKLPAKMKDPRSFTISCIVGDSQVGKALCDLGASINLMSFSFFQKLKIGTLRPTTITLQMADRSVSYPRGIVEDILVKVNDFIFPVDFVVLDMEEDRKVPLIPGRPFLATWKAMIDVQKGKLTL
ncbi:probable serine/threonine-protein kinase glkA [Salvia splendens]|uniref:probable serine/threonine-protein kinase glkA n=1 Tax=Salvia splendens TaxID=180675 RepID=UPI001C26F542|nr:probable serine/threonine-protein kinase glkA [Salvia splendens]